jgi:hypothetical protein
METHEDKQGFTVNDEEQRIRKPAQRSAANVLEHNRKLPGIGAHAFGQDSNRFAETSA